MRDHAPELPSPVFWWGPRQPIPTRRTLHELGERGVAPPWVLAALATLTDIGCSLIVAAADAGVGKSTLLAALLAAVSPERGMRFVPPGPMPAPSAASRHVTFISGEMSPHHPAYLWGEDLAQVILHMEHGAQLLTTAHADDGIGVARILSSVSGPPSAQVSAQLPIVVVLRPDRHAQFTDCPLSRIAAVWRIGMHAGELIQTELVSVDGDRDGALEQILRVMPAFPIDRCLAWERHIKMAPAAPRDSDRPGVMLDRAERERVRDPRRA